MQAWQVTVFEKDELDHDFIWSESILPDESGIGKQLSGLRELDMFPGRHCQ